MSDIDVPQPGVARSFWLQEALASEREDEAPPLRDKVAADVCIVGGGFAGLWTAIELSTREPGMRIALLESDICGGGASGRNGGFFSCSWWDLEGLCRLYGEESGVRYASALRDQIYEARDFCEENSIDAWFHIDGVLIARLGGWQEDSMGGGAEIARRNDLRDPYEPLDAAGARSYADSPLFSGGTFLKDSATVQPARLARGLRRVLLERGVRIFEGTRAKRVEQGVPAIVRTENGAVRADHVVLTHGAWAASWPGFRTSFANIADFMVATEPIPERIEEIGWRTDVGIGDSREMLYYLRRTDDGRIAIGGGASGLALGARMGRHITADPRIARRAAEGLIAMFPQLRGIRFTHAWGGPIDMTASFTPFFGTDAFGSTHWGLGFSGHGLAATKLGGKTLASLVLGSDDEWSRLPVVGPPVGRVPPEPLRWPMLRAGLWALESGDRRQEEGRPRGLMRSVIGGIPVRNRERLRSGR
jgi:glycine/D-amino acid oxidase-like deaminating enzyme